MTTRPGISVIIPAYNENDRLKLTVNDIKRYLADRNMKHEIIVVDDGSECELFGKLLVELEKAKKIKVISYPDNIGKGYAVRQGLAEAKYRTCLILDADHSVQINELDYFFDRCESYAIYQKVFLYGDRVQVIKQPLHRIFIGKCFKLLVWALTGIYADTQAPFKLLNLNKEFYRKLTVDGFAYDVELFYLAKKMFIKTEPLKVMYFNSEASKVTIKKTVQMAKDIWCIRWH